MRAIVVLPVPGGPKRIIDGGRSSSIARRSAEPGASTCCWPTRSSSEDGRRRTASGAFSAWRSRAASEKRSATREVCSRPDVATRRGHSAPAGASSARHRQSSRERDAGGGAPARLPRPQNGVECELYAREPHRANLVGAHHGRRRAVARLPVAYGHGARRSSRVGSRSLVGRPRRRRGLGARRARHEGPGRGKRRRVRVARARGVRALGRPRPPRRRRRGGRCGLRTELARRAASRGGALRLRVNEGGGERLVIGGTPVLPLCDRGEDVRAVQGARPRPKRPCVDARHRRQRAREGGSLPGGARLVRAAARAHPRGEGLARGDARRGSAARRGPRTCTCARPDARRPRGAAPLVHAVADDDRRVAPAKRHSGGLRDHRRLPAPPGDDAGGRRALDPRGPRGTAATSSSSSRPSAARAPSSRRRSGTPLEQFTSEIEPGARMAPMACPGFTDSHFLRQAFGPRRTGTSR